MIIGAHLIIYSTKPEADSAFLRNVLKLTHVDVGGGTLIFGLPPAEVAVHQADKNDVHEVYLMCDDVNAFVDELTMHGIACGLVGDRGWGLVTQVTLPGGGKLGVYQPRHARPQAMSAEKPPAKKPARRARKKPVKKAAKKPAKKAMKKPARRKRR